MNIIGITRVTGIIAPAYSAQNCDDNMAMDDSASAQVMESNKTQSKVEIQIEILLGKDKGT